MSLLTSLSAGTSGLSSASSELAVVGDNIANANTVGFKAERAAFEDTLAQSVVGGSGQIGLGSRLQGVQKIMTEGALQTTGVATDLALQGAGFFVVSGTAGDGRSGTHLTRAGQFTVDRDGFLVTLGGLRVQGYPADAAGRVSTAVGDLQVGDASTLPHATGSVRVGANLQADAVVPPAWDPADPTGTSTFCTTVTLYDSLGKAHDTSVYFRNQGGGQWEWHALSDGGALVGGTAGVATEIAAGTLTFDAQGRLQDVTQATNFNPLGAVSPQPFTLNFGDPTAAGGTGLAGITQFASASATTFVGQDGYPSGELSSIQIDRRGVVVGTFSNGQTRPLGQVGVARVAAPEMLERSGENLYTVTSSSGYAVVGAAGDGGRGFISSGTLEQSNVEISEQFVRMIAAQRSFEANAKTITTADQLLSELISMKR